MQTWIPASGFFLIGYKGQHLPTPEPIIAWVTDDTCKSVRTRINLEPLTVTGIHYAGHDANSCAIQWPNGHIDYKGYRYATLEAWRSSDDWKKDVAEIAARIKRKRGF